MSNHAIILATLILYQVVLLAIGVWASRRTHDEGDFFLGGRRLGGWVAALSASASSSSAWTLLGVSGAAYAWGLSAIWLFPACVGGFLINWLVIAPRLMTASREDGSLTLTQFLAGTSSDGKAARWLASIVIVFSFVFYIAAQFQAAGLAFSTNFELSPMVSIAIGVAVVVAYTMLGGFWAVSVTDTVQGFLMAATAVVLPIAGLVAVGGVGGLMEHLSGEAPFGPRAGIVALGFVAGTLGIGLGYPGQPHVVNRFMALRDGASLRTGRVVSIAWAVVIYSGMLVTGWCGRVLHSVAAEGEEVFFSIVSSTFHPVVAGVLTAAVLSAIMSTADSQLLVASSSIALDLRGPGPNPRLEPARSLDSGSPSDVRSEVLTRIPYRLVVLVISVVAMLIAMFAPSSIFNRVLFAWHALGSAFGPALIVRLAGRRVPQRWLLVSMLTGFGLTVLFYLMPNTPGDWLERLVPFGIALTAALAGSRSRGLQNTH